MDALIDKIINKKIKGGDMDSIINFFKMIYSTEAFHLVFQIFLITILSGIIGLEREYSSKPAGFRTHVLVGISAVLVTVCGMKIAQEFGTNDPSRIPAQLLSGIGFIGAGTILSNGMKVKGLTTASGLLAVTCVGLIVGARMYLYAIFVTLFIFVVLKYSYKLNSKVDHMVTLKFKILTSQPKELVGQLSELLTKYNAELRRAKTIEDDEDERDSFVIYEVKANRLFNKNGFIGEIASLDDVIQVTELN